VQKLKRGNDKALQVFYKKNASKYKYLIYRYVEDEAIAEDLLHDGFIRVIRKISQFKNSGSFEGWVRRILINLALEHLRKNKKIRFSDTTEIDDVKNDCTYENMAFANEIDLDDLSENKVSMEVVYAANFTDEDLEEALGLLPDHYKVVFNLYVIDGFKHREISEMLGINEKTSKSRLSKARKITQTYLYKKAISKIRKEQHEPY
jgi:RNA polymerase sigma-70 factor (ECF subfamily)